MLTVPEMTCPVHVFAWSSFDPEKRAAQATAEANETLAQIAKLAEELGLTQEQVEPTFRYFVKIKTAHWAATARCASPMITGPARFPVERNRKRRETEHKRLGVVCQFYETWEHRLRRLAEPLKIAEGETIERTEHGIRIIENAEVDRLQLIFSAKPEPETIALLKSRGFKWSPRFSAWQRQLTENARKVTAFLLPKIAELEA